MVEYVGNCDACGEQFEINEKRRCPGCNRGYGNLVYEIPTPEHVAACCAQFRSGWSPEVREWRTAAAYRKQRVDFSRVVAGQKELEQWNCN